MNVDSWVSVVTQFPRGDLDGDAFIGRARDPEQQTEAHAYVGLKAAIFGQREEALKHLRWVRGQGTRAASEYPPAVAELRRLEPPVAASP